MSLQKQNLKCESMKAEQIISTVIFRDNLIPIVLKSIVLIKVMKNLEGVLRETQIRSIHEVEKLKRAQEMRVDEFSVQKLRESHATIQELTSQIQELQERVNFLNDSRESQDRESICSGKLSHVPSHPAVVHGICLGDRETFWAIHEQ